MVEDAVGEGADDSDAPLWPAFVARPGGGSDHPGVEERASFPYPQGEPVRLLQQDNLLFREGSFNGEALPSNDGGVRVDHPPDVPAGESPSDGGGARCRVKQLGERRAAA